MIGATGLIPDPPPTHTHKSVYLPQLVDPHPVESHFA